MTTNQERAAEVIYDHMVDADAWPTALDGRDADDVVRDATQALADAGLITPDLPVPARGMTAPTGMVWPASESDMSIISPKIDTSTEHDDSVNMTPEQPIKTVTTRLVIAQAEKIQRLQAAVRVAIAETNIHIEAAYDGFEGPFIPVNPTDYDLTEEDMVDTDE